MALTTIFHYADIKSKLFGKKKTSSSATKVYEIPNSRKKGIQKGKVMK